MICKKETLDEKFEKIKVKKILKKLRLQEKGITLIALVVTIVILLILAGVTINIALSDNGLFGKAKEASEEYQKAQLKEEIETEILNLQTETLKSKKELTDKEIEEIINNKGIIISEIKNETNNIIEGEYDNYEVIIDENRNVIIGNKLVGEKPTGEVIILPAEEEDPIEIDIQVTASTTDGDIKSIDAINGAILKEDRSANEKIFKVTENGQYSFKITGTNGRICILKSDYINALTEELMGTSILDGVSKVENSGKKKIAVSGKINDLEENVTYTIDAVVYDGNLVLDGSNEVLGVVPKDNVYEFGRTKDAGTNTANATNTVLLKVNGNLTINSGVTLTSIKNSDGYGGPKGLLIYCTGTITNNGTISMTARGAKAEGQNVYLWKNGDGTFEYVPSTGAGGGNGIKGNEVKGATGLNGIGRQTGGGGSGAVRYSTSKSGSAGTSYSGGSGSGGSCEEIAGAGGANGGSGGHGARGNSTNGLNGGGGAGNPRWIRC